MKTIFRVRPLFRWTLPLLAAASFVASPASGAVPRKAGDIQIDAASTAVVNGVPVQYELGTLFVPENRASAKSRIIGVGFARMKASAPSGAPPVFWLPGGPPLSVLGAFSGQGQSRLELWASLRSVGDLIVLEQRGYTVRGEMLEAPTRAVPLDRPASVQAQKQDVIALARAAVAANPDKDLSGYTLVQLAADVDDLRRALGYEKITLFGGSFASQWSLAVIRLYPQIVARAALSSTEPLDGYDVPSQVLAVLQRIAFDADRDPGLAPYLPAGGLMAAIEAVHERLATTPAKVTVKDGNGRPQTVVLGMEDFQLALISHPQDGVDWPAFILSIYHRHYDDWAREVIEQRASGSEGLIRALIDTSTGVSPARLHRLRTDPATGLLGTWAFEIDVDSAPAWPTPDLGEEFRTAVVSPVPVLFVHGDWDMSTPVDNTLSLLPFFPKGHAILVHRAGHDGTFYQLREQPAAKAAVYEFLRTGEMKNLPVSVSLSLPKFTIPSFPALPVQSTP
jgi:pimeloyl-ACP methyl ester carboxylesterase